jgi:SAM-dependent MidA family methyltransferase
MQIYIIALLLLYSGAVSGGSEKVLGQAEIIAHINQQLPHGCTFIIDCGAQQQGEE